MTDRLKTSLRIGFPRLRKEQKEVRDFLPAFTARLSRLGAGIVLERGYGLGMGFAEGDYLQSGAGIVFDSREAAFRQPIVVLLRCPEEDELRWMAPGACLLSMLHFPTRPRRVELLRSLGLEAVSFDGLKDDSGRRLVENLRAVAWNGVEAAVRILARTYPAPGFENPRRGPIRVTVMGAGAVGGFVVQAAVRYGNETLHRRLADAGVPGVQVTAVDYDFTAHGEPMRTLLRGTDILVDATQRPDPSRCVIPNAWIADLPGHAVILDLSVDPYDPVTGPGASRKAIEGIPQGDLDRFIIAPDDPAYASLPAGVDSRNRRWVASCYSWPGIYPQECMEVYGSQLRPILRKILERNGVANIRPAGSFFERAISRAMLSRWNSGRAGRSAPTSPPSAPSKGA
jgi:alanine dehydrogenase